MKIANDYGLDVGQLKHAIITPALATLGLASEAAINLVTGTALAESHARYVKQINDPALGLWQMEPATHKDIWQNYLHYKPDLVAKLTFIMNGQERGEPTYAQPGLWGCPVSYPLFTRQGPTS
ncbi:hypothetical protein [Entomobacter blattae]|uniref:Uncharacterized protein n=1 Tax=Entomobacter blattae TaxID=2762277 RepID=A0A7H1NTQ9_9PROT|nr:hypothetical protein JGUZn3_19640 [Entomobacter blattae]